MANIPEHLNKLPEGKPQPPEPSEAWKRFVEASRSEAIKLNDSDIIEVR